MSRHTIVVEVAEEGPAYLRPKTAEEIEEGLSRHIECWAGWPISVVEYHHEQMTEDPGDYVIEKGTYDHFVIRNTGTGVLAMDGIMPLSFSTREAAEREVEFLKKLRSAR